MLSLSQSPVLYQPTDAEICGVLAAARALWPTLTSRIDRAQDILRMSCISIEPVAWCKSSVVHWQIASQTHSGSYIVPGFSMQCPCPDRAQYIGDVKYCKHTIALSAYRRILLDRFNADIQAREIDLGILHTGDFHAYAKGLGIVLAHKASGFYHFSDADSCVKYSLWLAKQNLLEWHHTFRANSTRDVVAA